MSFAECNKSYENSQRIGESGVIGHPVAFRALGAFDKARKVFAQSVKESGLHPAWEEGAKFFNTIHAKLARTPCRPCWLISDLLEGGNGQKVLNEIYARKGAVDGGILGALEKVMLTLEPIKSIESSPLLGPIKTAGFAEGRTLFVLRDRRLWDEVESCLSSTLEYDDWEIVKPSSLRSQRYADRLVIFGPAWYLGFRNEEYLLRAPAAPEIHLIACEHEFAGEINQSLLGGSGDAIQITNAPKTQGGAVAWEFEPIAPSARGQFHFKSSTGSKIFETGKTVTAVPFRLGGAHGTYFAKDSAVWVLAVDFSGSIPVCIGVEKTPVEDLEAGSLVLVTTSGGGDMIPVVADMLLPPKHRDRIRSLQRAWKAELLKRVEQESLERVAMRLFVLGAKKAFPTNLRNWCNPRNIGMENLETDLMAVLRLVQMESRYEEIASGIGRLRSAHQSAGSQLQTKLRESLLQKDLGDVFRHGQMEVRHGDGPAKTVFLVEDRGEEQEIPEEWEGELREIDD